MNNKYITQQEFMENNNLLAESFNKIFVVLGDITNKIDSLENKLGKIDKRLDKIDKRLDNVEKRLDNVEKRLDGVENKIDKLEYKVNNNTNMLHKAIFEIKKMREDQTVFAYRQIKNTNILEAHDSRLINLEKSQVKL